MGEKTLSDSETDRRQEAEARKLTRSAGAAYGLIFGLSFALIIWGRDGALLASARANLAWAKLLLGLPIAVIVASLIGWLASLFSSTAIYITLWAIAGALLSWIAGRMPFDGGNIAVWLTDRRLWGLPVFPYGESAQARTELLLLIGGGIGIAVGFLESLAVQWAWDRATPRGRMSLQSWIVLLVCIPLVIPLATLAEDLVYQRVRVPQQRVSESVALALSGAGEDVFKQHGLNYFAVDTFREDLSQSYVIHQAGYRDIGGYTSTQIDAVFEDGFALRCETTEVGMFFSPEHRVLICTDISKKYAGWMDDLIHASLTGERRWSDDPMRTLSVEEDVINWLNSHNDRIGASYQVTRAGQQGGWVFMSARFDTGFEMICRFHGTSSVQLDQCEEVGQPAP
ncbi:MAG: hypothetical protein JW918_06795 [Anaerolineae bacterium]|nr:hypothetical protein [Anaerolineae bacterium]